ncbi:hypothetical protein DSM14862_03577 (plasmid) [Sulfitobacter indolifex]|nr:hypothetical protein DSM14862_03577 [Sulfitobacter indolifex]
MMVRTGSIPIRNGLSGAARELHELRHEARTFGGGKREPVVLCRQTIASCTHGAAASLVRDRIIKTSAVIKLLTAPQVCREGALRQRVTRPATSELLYRVTRNWVMLSGVESSFSNMTPKSRPGYQVYDRKTHPSPAHRLSGQRSWRLVTSIAVCKGVSPLVTFAIKLAPSHIWYCCVASGLGSSDIRSEPSAIPASMASARRAVTCAVPSRRMVRISSDRSDTSAASLTTRHLFCGSSAA